jgi:putative NIF3 family GTP cyclohydrolase 1 type 2
VKQHAVGAVEKAMKMVHPYEEIAYGILELKNKDYSMGAGLIGELSDVVSELDFFEHIKKTFNTGTIRHTQLLNKPIKKVALCGGSGSFLLQDALNHDADIFITSDYKYHQFFDAENRLVIADIGHYESEQYTPEIFYEILSKKFPKFAFQLSSVNTNPVYYY